MLFNRLRVNGIYSEIIDFPFVDSLPNLKQDFYKYFIVKSVD